MGVVVGSMFNRNRKVRALLGGYGRLLYESSNGHVYL